MYCTDDGQCDRCAGHNSRKSKRLKKASSQPLNNAQPREVATPPRLSMPEWNDVLPLPEYAAAPTLSPLAPAPSVFSNPFPSTMPNGGLFPSHPLPAPQDAFGTNLLVPARSVSVDQAFLNNHTHYPAPGQLPGRLSVPSWAPTMAAQLSNETYGAVDSTGSSMIPTPIPTQLTDSALDYFRLDTTNPVPNAMPMLPPGPQDLGAHQELIAQGPAAPQPDAARETLLDLLRSCQAPEQSLRFDGTATDAGTG